VRFQAAAQKRVKKQERRTAGRKRKMEMIRQARGLGLVVKNKKQAKGKQVGR
jgi:hypothetical protein